MNKRILGGAPVIVVLFFILGITSCEQEDRFVGANVVGDNAAQFHKAYVDVTAKTLMPDTLRADRKVLQNATLGVYNEGLFGKTKSDFYSQVRLGTINPGFGENAIVDSVILSIPVFGNTTEEGDTISIQRHLMKTIYTLSNTDEGCSVSDTVKQYENKYLFEMDSIYGNRDTQMTLQVHRILGDLKTIDSTRYSNQTMEIGELFGSMPLTSQVYKTSVYQRRTSSSSDSVQISADSNPTIKMHLDGMKNFVQNNIVNQEGSTNLGDQISFINNVLRGIRIGVADENGFIFNFNPSNLGLTAYISSDNEEFVDANGNGVQDAEEDCPVSSTQARITQNLNFIVGSSLSVQSGVKFYNVVQNHIINENGTIPYNQENLATNYVEGMGGAKTQISLDAQQIEAVRDSVRNRNWVITEAHFKIYPDTNVQGELPLPQYLYAYNYSDADVLPDYVECNSTVDNPQGFPYLQISRPYGDNNNDYYLLRVTEYIKNIVEENAEIDHLAVEMGSYLGFTSQCYFYRPANAYFSNRVFNPYRLAFVGANGDANKKLQLEIYYNKREN